MADIFPTGYFCASRFLNTLSAEEAESGATAVVWCGPVGICAIATASKRLGAKPLLLTEEPGAAIEAATDGRGADDVLELVGTLDAMRLYLDIVHPSGSIGSVGVQMETVALEGPVLYGKNGTIAWGRCPVRGIFEEVLQILGKVQDKVSFLCECSMKLEEAAEAYRLFNDRKVQMVFSKNWSAKKLDESIVNDRKHHRFEVVARMDASLAAQIARSDKLIFIGQAKQTTLLTRNTKVNIALNLAKKDQCTRMRTGCTSRLQSEPAEGQVHVSGTV
ncbi:chaperonin 10-like protein [Penicillium canescens]|nr:chaperonin 10-like protein [Penicillium canescens]